jgi:Lar family restriction alleviation protein
VERLKRCPFCGEKALVENLNDKSQYYHRKLPWRVKCSKCHCALAYQFFETKEHAIKEWNRRV